MLTVRLSGCCDNYEEWDVDCCRYEIMTVLVNCIALSLTSLILVSGSKYTGQANLCRGVIDKHELCENRAMGNLLTTRILHQRMGNIAKKVVLTRSKAWLLLCFCGIRKFGVNREYKYLWTHKNDGVCNLLIYHPSKQTHTHTFLFAFQKVIVIKCKYSSHV